MPSKAKRVVVEPTGAIVVGRDVQSRLRAFSGNYRLVSDSAGVVLLRRELAVEAHEPDNDPEDAALDMLDVEDLSLEVDTHGRVILAGEILSRMTLFQMVEIVAERGFTGDLVVSNTAGATFELRMDRGALKGARSDQEEDRLGQILVRAGHLSQDALEDLLGEVDAHRRIGEVCLSRNLVGEAALFECLQRQVESIFYRALLITDGSFILTSPDPTRPSPALSLHLPVRPLLMHGIQRLDEMELYRERIPGSDVCLERRPEVEARELSSEEQEVLELCSGTTPLADIISRTGLSEYEVTRTAYHLVRRRIASIAVRAAVHDGALVEQVEGFSAVLEHIFAVIGEHGDQASALAMVDAWIGGCGYDSIFGPNVATRAKLDLEHIRGWVAGVREDNPLSSFHQVAQELVSFSMFCAGSALRREQEAVLSQEVNARLEAIPKPSAP